MSLCILNVGDAYTGKTTWAINFAKKMGLPTIANDPQTEEKYRKNKWIKVHRGSPDEFIQDIIVGYNFKASCHTIIIDESGDIFSNVGVGKLDVKKPFRARRFNGNIYILNFHDLIEIPDYVIRFTDYFNIGWCGADPNKVKKKYEAYPHIYQTWLKVLQQKNLYERKMVRKIPIVK